MFVGFHSPRVVRVCGSFPTSTDQIKRSCGTPEFLDHARSPHHNLSQFPDMSNFDQMREQKGTDARMIPFVK